MARRRLREDGMIDRISILVAENYNQKNNLNLTYEEFDELSKTDEIRKQAIFNLNVVDLESRLIEDYGGTRTSIQCAEEALYIMDNIPEELIPNVEEWLDNKPLSDINVHGMSINYLINTYPLCFHIYAALNCFIKWKETGYKNKNFCKNYFSRA